MKTTFVALFFLGALSAVASIPNFSKVNADLLRGGRPDGFSDFQMLKKKGVRTVLNLETTPNAVKKEKAWAKDLGMDLISVPLDWETEPSDENVDFLIEAMSDPARAPVFIHCFHGRDRAGLMVGLYRVFVDKWKPERAYEEMLEKGFSPEFKALVRYFNKKTQ